MKISTITHWQQHDMTMQSETRVFQSSIAIWKDGGMKEKDGERVHDEDDFASPKSFSCDGIGSRFLLLLNGCFEV